MVLTSCQNFLSDPLFCCTVFALYGKRCRWALNDLRGGLLLLMSEMGLSHLLASFLCL